eukprot:scaffold8564_cov90-Isochrysis_galbana.AAC.2
MLVYRQGAEAERAAVVLLNRRARAVSAGRKCGGEATNVAKASGLARLAQNTGGEHSRPG